VVFTFSTAFIPSASTLYAASPKRDGAASNTNYYFLVGNASSVYAGGTNIALSVSSGLWATVAQDAYFVASEAGYAYYFIGRDGTTATTLQAFKSTAPDTSWASVTSKTGFTTAILNIAGYQVGSVIHLAVQDGTAMSSVATKYLSFDAATDTFLATTETVLAASSIATAGGGNAGQNCSLVVRSNGNVVIFYNGTQAKVSGTFYSNVWYRERTGVNTYGTAVQVSALTAFDNSTPFAVLGAANRVHFAWTSGATTAWRTLSAANAQNTAGSTASMTAPGDGVSYDRSGTTKVVFTSNVNGSQGTLRLDSSDNPTVTFANQSIAAATIPHRIGVDISNDEVTIAYRSSADSDLYAIKSTDDGATFGSPASLFVGTVANADANLSKNASGGMYQRGSNFVVGYIVNDNGTLKYNEYVIRSVSTNKTLTADGGNYLLTGTTAAAVLLKRKIDATTAGSYSYTGTDVTISKAAPPKRLTADPGSYLLTGAATTTILRRARIDATAAAYALTGASTTTVLHKSRIDATVGGAYALTGASTTSLLHKYRPQALGGSYLLTGTDAAVTKAVTLVNKTLPAGTASYALTGTAASVLRQFKAAGLAGSYSLAGAATTSILHKDRLTAGTASYALTGTDAAIIKRTFKTLAAGTASYALTGTATAILHAWRPTAGSGSYALTGTAATPWHGYKVIAGASNYALTGNATAVLLHRWKTAALAGSYALTGNSATFLIHKDIVSAAPGAYALTGTAANFQIRSDKFVSAASGTYALTGTPASVRKTWKAAATASSYAITGTDAALTRRVPKTLTAGTASYALTGAAASVLHRWKTAALGGSYALTGSPATVVHSFKIAATPASYALTGTAATITKVEARTVTAAPGAYALTGAPAATLHRAKLPATAGSYALTGSAATVRYGYKVPAGASSYALTGTAALFPRTRRITADPLIGRYQVTGGLLTRLLYNWTFRATGSSYAITGTPTILRRVRTITAAPASYALTGKPAIINKVGLLYLVAEPASYLLTGNVARIFTGEWGISDRTVLAVAEDRSIKVAAELRSVKAITEARRVIVPAELRTVAVPEEFRTIEARGENHGVSAMATQGSR